MILDVEKWLFFYDQIYKMNVPIKNGIIEECKKSKKPIWYTLLKWYASNLPHAHLYQSWLIKVYPLKEQENFN